MIRVKYIGPVLDSSGYAEATRNHIAALHTVDINVDVQPISFENQKTDLGEVGELVKQLINPKSTAPIHILHATPENYPRLKTEGKYTIGYAAWETDRLPKHWINNINQLNEIWVPSLHNKKMMHSSGINVPIYVMPHPFNAKEYSKHKTTKFNIQGLNDKTFTFYSIFQWLERKNPIGLLRAFLSEFTSDDDVALVLKTFMYHPGAAHETEKIKQLINNTKSYMFLKNPPKIFLINQLLTREEIFGLHNKGDCFISLNRAEGFGMPLVEAMLAGKPVISSTYGGQSDFILGDLNQDPNQVTGFAVPYQMTPVAGMPWQIYTGDMNWAEPDLGKAKEYMREVYEKRSLADKVAKQGQKFVTGYLSWGRVGSLMKARLEQITV